MVTVRVSDDRTNEAGRTAGAFQMFRNAVERGGGNASNGKPSFTIDRAGAEITRTQSTWNGVNVLGRGATVTYSFRATADGMPGDVSQFSRFNAAQIAAAELALANWSDVANITFVRVAPNGFSNAGQIAMGNFGLGAEGAGGFASGPGSDPDAGDLWVRGDAQNRNPVPGSVARAILTHELGHSIGLSHPGDYNGAGALSYENDATYYEDNHQYSIMSYWSEQETGGDFRGFNSTAPMLDDIAAAQRLYGANLTTRTGDTVYGFHSNTGRDWLTATADLPMIAAIWDAGGTDTLDFSGYAVSQVFDLRAGNFSNTGGLIGNVAIAQGAVIENAIGGTAADLMFGNAAANRLDGNGGIDELHGFAGNDRLIARNGGAPTVVAAANRARGSRNQAFSVDGAFNTLAHSDIGDASATPHAIVDAVSNGTTEFFSFTAAVGATITLDMDHASFDTIIYLYDAAGQLLASNDDSRTIDPGSSVTARTTEGQPLATDSFLNYVATSAGTYYVEVRGYQENGSGPTPAGGRYQLNVSVTGHALTGEIVGSVLDGGANDDVLISGAAGDTLIGGDGIDTANYELATSAVSVRLDVGGKQDTRGSGSDTLTGIENLAGSSFDDTLRGDKLANRLAGGGGNDMLLGGDGIDVLDGGMGNDVLNGGLGVDTADYLEASGGVTVDLSLALAQNTGSAGTDTLKLIEAVRGSRFDDTLTSAAGGGRLRGGEGNDTLRGGQGVDQLYGEGGADTLTGGAGRDRFYFTATVGGTNVDTITDFTAADDLIALWSGTFTGVAKAATLAASAFHRGAAAHDSDDRIIYNAATGALFYDQDGTGSGAAVQFASIGRNLNLTNANFSVV